MSILEEMTVHLVKNGFAVRMAMPGESRRVDRAAVVVLGRITADDIGGVIGPPIHHDGLDYDMRMRRLGSEELLVVFEPCR